MTLKKLALLTQIPYTSLRHIVRGRPTGVMKVSLIARELGVSPDAIVKGSA